MVFRIILLFQHTIEKYAFTVFGSFWLVSVPKIRIKKKGIQIYCMLFWWCGVFMRKLDLKKQLNWKVCILDLTKNGKSWKSRKKKKKKESILRVWTECCSLGETTWLISSEPSPCLFRSLLLFPGIGRDLSSDGFITCFRAKSENPTLPAVSQIPVVWIIRYTKLQYFWSSLEPHHRHYIQYLLYYFVLFIYFLVILGVTKRQFKLSVIECSYFGRIEN